MQYLYTCRPSGALKGWCAVRTLQIVLFKQALRGVFESPLCLNLPKFE